MANYKLKQNYFSNHPGKKLCKHICLMNLFKKKKTFQIQFSISGNASPELRTWNVPEHRTEKLKIVSEKIFVIKPFRIFPEFFFVLCSLAHFKGSFASTRPVHSVKRVIKASTKFSIINIASNDVGGLL